MKEIRLHVTDETHKKLKQIAKDRETFLATIVREVLVDYVKGERYGILREDKKEWPTTEELQVRIKDNE